MESIVSIANLKPFMKNLHLQFIVLQQGSFIRLFVLSPTHLLTHSLALWMIGEEVKVTREGHEIYSYIVADATGSIELLLWDEIGKCIRIGDILRLSSGQVV